MHLALDNLEDASSKSKSIILALLEAKSDYKLKNRKRRTPYELAVFLKKYTLAGLVAKYDEFAVKIETKKKKKRWKGRYHQYELNLIEIVFYWFPDISVHAEN